MKFIRLTNRMTAPAVRPFPVSARYAPARNTPSCAMIPVVAPIMPTSALSLRRLNFSCSSARLLSANRRKISFSARKVLTTENPPRQSESAAVKSRFWSETRFSAACSCPPVSSDAISGRTVTPAAMAVIKGEYHSIIASAPKNVTAFVMTESNWERSSASMLAASLVSAERYAAVLSARKEEMLFSVSF